MAKNRFEKNLELITSRFSTFNAQTKLSDEDFKRIQEAAGAKIKLDEDRRAAIQLLLQRFEFFRHLEGKEYGAAFRSVLRSLEADLDNIISCARVLDELPGHLWAFVTYNAEVNRHKELQRLEAIRDQVKQLNATVDAARKRRTADRFLPWLLEGLEREFRDADGGSTGISRGRGKRGGKFLIFCRAAIAALPEARRPKKDVSAQWERVLAKRSKNTLPNPREPTWIGRPLPVLALM